MAEYRPSGVLPYQSPETSQAVLETNALLIESIAKITGKTVELLTRIPEMNFDDVEIEQLQKVWTPILPTVSPLLTAILVTSSIVGTKAAIFVAIRKKEKTEVRKQKIEEKEKHVGLSVERSTVSGNSDRKTRTEGYQTSFDIDLDTAIIQANQAH